MARNSHAANRLAGIPAGTEVLPLSGDKSGYHQGEGKKQAHRPKRRLWEDGVSTQKVWSSGLIPIPSGGAGTTSLKGTLKKRDQDEDDQDYVQDSVGRILINGLLRPAKSPVTEVEKGDEETYEEQRAITADPGSSQLEGQGEAGRTVGNIPHAERKRR